MPNNKKNQNHSKKGGGTTTSTTTIAEDRATTSDDGFSKPPSVLHRKKEKPDYSTMPNMLAVDMMMKMFLSFDSTSTANHGNDYCHGCGKPEADIKLLRCGACKKSRFCSKECQLANWPSRKEQCLQIRKERKMEVKETPSHCGGQRPASRALSGHLL